MKGRIISNLVLVAALLFIATAQGTQNTTMSIVTGPIIGKVTTTTARILLEFNSTGSAALVLTDPSGKTFTLRKNVKASIPIPFVFTGLQANTKYLVSLNDKSIPMVESYFTTLSGESGKLNFAVVSCMDRNVQATKEPKADLWADMLRRVQNNEISYLLQTGDQVYMDDPFGNVESGKPYYTCIKILNETSRDQWDSKKDQLLEILRDEYRQTWNIQSVKETLAKVPSLTIFDDHQIRDDWGYLTQDTDPNSVDYYYGTLARQVYYEYERQLREDINFNDLSNLTREYYYETLNDVGFFFLDYRGVRTWDRNYSQIGNTQLGLNQTQLLKQVLDPVNGTFANLNNFFLISPLSVVLLIEPLVRLGYYSNNDAQESWSYAYGSEQAQLLGLLRDWKLAKSGREVTILDGDVHMGGFTDITYEDDYAFLQFTSSSIASSAPNDVTFAGFEALKEIQDLEDPWSYEHHDWTNKFNYGIVRANYADNKATADCFLVEADSDDEPKIVNVDGDSLDNSDWEELLGKTLLTLDASLIANKVFCSAMLLFMIVITL